MMAPQALTPVNTCQNILRTCSRSVRGSHWSAIGMSGSFGCAAWARAHASSRGAKAPSSSARFHSNPSGKCLAGRSAALHRLPIARAIGRALRLASHPGKVRVRLQKDLEQALSPPVFRRVRARAEEGAAPAVKLGPLWPKSPFLPLSPNRLMLPASCATAALRCSARPQWPSGSAVICRRSWRSIPIGQLFLPMNF